MSYLIGEHGGAQVMAYPWALNIRIRLLGLFVIGYNVPIAVHYRDGVTSPSS
ncbi:MAG: hypothetical protein AAGI88_25800 [Pseudomonadota bacterium]